MEMKKVLFFDSWKGGARHFKRLVEPLGRAGIDCFLLHLGSWGNESQFLQEEMLGNLKTRDVSFYKGMGFRQILEAERPDLVFFLSTATFAHRAFIRYCHLLGIPTIHSYHGIVRMQDVDGGASPHKANLWRYTLFAAQKIPKLLKKTFPTYIRSMLATRAPLRDWGHFLENILHFVTKPAVQKVAPDAKTTRCIVYTDVDKPHAVEKYGFSMEEIVAVGNPDIIDFKLNLNRRPQLNVAPTNRVVYIDTAFLSTGLFFQSEAEYIAHLLHTHESLVEQGYRLCFKPHPATEISLEKLAKKGIELLDNDNLVEELDTCCAVVSEPSSLSIIPALMGVPLVLPTYGRLASLRFGHVLASYPLSKYLSDVNDFNRVLAECRDEFDQQKLEAWIATNAGPLPPEEMPNRVVEVVIDLIERSQKVSAN